ncbi:hypothetical protein RD792_011285 [Penstemon davidsonii]|uniref:SAP domain-containing protein n=1 Tax=Penstemon davidsonii TaxID=160366 RepID=A0ABR0D458_9LAMI|nr:hypothetical protein RD792_011285 [Penstemon davidsonii]
MLPALKLGFRYSSLRSFSAVNFNRIPKFSLNLKMGSKKRHCSNSSNNDVSKLQKNSAKASVTKSEVCGDDCENTEEMTLKQFNSKLRRGIPSKGAKQELVCALKSKMNGEDSSNLQDQVISEEKPALIKTYSTRKAKGLSDKDHVQIANNDSDISGVKRTKRRLKQSAVDTIDLKTSQSTSEQEQISIEMKGETSIRAKRKVSSKITTSNMKAHVSVGLSVKEPWAVLTHKKPQKGWTAYNPETMRPPPIGASTPHMKLMSWNVNGLRALLKLENFSALQLAQRENFDVLCLQETKLQACAHFILS